MTVMLPERFGRYEVLAEIGDGAMGRVYSAWDPAVSRVVAVKTVKSELLTRETASEYLKRFRHEAQAAGALNHPQVVRVFDIGDDYLVMEYVEGRTLQAMIRASGRIAPEETLRLLGPVADAIDHAHRLGIVHRDIKPANIMIQPDGQPKLMDFGVAHLAASVMTTAGQILGSPSYMSPEQIAGQEVTGRSDVYSLAVVAYEMLTGQPPFQGKTITQVIYRVMHELAPPPRKWNTTLPQRFDDVFARALAKDPAQRFASAGEFASALDVRELEHVLSAIEEAPAPRPAGAEAPTLLTLPGNAAAPGARRLRSRVALFGAATAVVLAAVGWIALGRGPGAPAGSAETQPAAPAPAPATPAPDPGVTRAPKPARVPPVARPAPRAATPQPVVEGQLVPLGEGVTPPVRTSGAPAPYPEQARQRRLQGTVTIDLIVDETGTPTDLRVVESAGAVLDTAVLEAVRGWRFEPARKNGVRVKVRWTVRQTYRSR